MTEKEKLVAFDFSRVSQRSIHLNLTTRPSRFPSHARLYPGQRPPLPNNSPLGKTRALSTRPLNMASRHRRLRRPCIPPIRRLERRTQIIQRATGNCLHLRARRLLHPVRFNLCLSFSVCFEKRNSNVLNTHFILTDHAKFLMPFFFPAFVLLSSSRLVHQRLPTFVAVSDALGASDVCLAPYVDWQAI